MKFVPALCLGVVSGTLILLSVSSLAQTVKPVEDEKRQATVVPKPSLVKEALKPKAPQIPRGQFLYSWEDTEGGMHNDVVSPTGRYVDTCDGPQIEVRGPGYTHWIMQSELKVIRKQ